MERQIHQDQVLQAKIHQDQILQARTEFVKRKLEKLKHIENIPEIRAILIAMDFNMNQIRILKAKMIESRKTDYDTVLKDIEEFEQRMLELQTQIEAQRALKLGTAQMK